MYLDYSGAEATGMPGFNKFNLLYGWNYSGKTTLSRVLQCLEFKRMNSEYGSASFRIIKEDASVIESDNLSSAPTVRVFNRDYINENFAKEHSAPAVFILGKDNVELRERYLQLQTRLSKVERIATEYGNQKYQIETRLSKAGTETARKIRDLTGDSRFERPQLLTRLEEVKENPESNKLTDEVVQARLTTTRSSENFAELALVNYHVPDILELVNIVNKLHVRTASNQAVERLRQNPGLEEWVRHGLDIHKDADTCEFCGAELTNDRIDMLSGHFSQAYEGLLQDLDGMISQLEDIQFEFSLYHEKDLMPEVRQEYSKLVVKLEDWQLWFKQLRDSLIESLNQKKCAIESQNIWIRDIDRKDEGISIVTALNDVVKQHNKLVISIEQTRRDAKTALEQHYAAIHYIENDVYKCENNIDDLVVKSQRASLAKNKIIDVIQSVSNRISRSAIGASRLNELLKYLLSGSDIEVESVGDAEFRFTRAGQDAVNLSDGEKTAITFAYFLISLEAEGASLEDTIVFIDDPISSLDSNHVYAVYALIVEKLDKCRQLFVSTHNSEFFNLLKGHWLGPKGGDKQESRAYYISRKVAADGDMYSDIQDLPKLLRKYKSEYEFVFAHLFEFKEAVNPSEHEAYTAPNLVRKFLESYLGFRKPSVTAWYAKLDLLFDSVEKQREVHKFADDASHLHSMSRGLQQPAFVSSAQRIVTEVIEALEIKDPDHYLSLLEVVRV